MIIKETALKQDERINIWENDIINNLSDENKNQIAEIDDRLSKLYQWMNKELHNRYKLLFGYDIGDKVISRDEHEFIITSFDPKAKLFVGKRKKKDGEWATREEYFDTPLLELSKKIN